MAVGGQDENGGLSASESAVKYGKVFDYMLEGCQIISKDYRYLYLNKVAAEQGRKKREELLGKTMAECYPGIDGTEMFMRLRACVQYKKTCTIENQFRFPDGVVGWFELRMEPLPEGAIILSIDITSRKDAEEQRMEVEELRTVFMRIISSQMIAPLAGVRAELESAKQDGQPGSAVRGQLDVAYSAILEISECADDMIATLGEDAHADAPEQSVILFDEIWKPLYAQFKRDCALKQVRLTYAEPFMPLPRLRCDPGKIRLVLSRLVNNALTYTPPNGTITITAARRDETILFEISDSGIGIPSADQHRIFSRFCRGSNATAANPDGLGVSLAVAKYYIEQHNGKIGFTSTRNKGSTFWVKLPTNM